MTWKPNLPYGDEAAKIKHLIVPYTRGGPNNQRVVLDIGSGPWKPYPHFIGVDHANMDGSGNHWKAEIQRDGRDLSLFGDASVDSVFSSFLLDWLPDPESVLKEWWRVIKPDGHLVLYLPHANHYPNKGKEGCHPDHRNDFFPEDIAAAMELIGSWDLVENRERAAGNEYAFLQVYRKLTFAEHRQSWKAKAAITQPKCLVIRYGGIGDLIQISSILPHLKKQGFHVTLNCHPNGPDVVGHDPNIDAFWVQEPDQVPNWTLGDYWKNLGNEYERVCNMCESVEGTLLGIPGRHNHALSHPARHMYMNVNYLDFAHATAKVPIAPKHQRFYPTPDEDEEMRKYRKKLGDQPVLLWSLAGSSIHKTWPWVADAVLRLLEETTCKVVFVGDKLCQLLEMAVGQMILSFTHGIQPEESHKMKLSEMLEKIKEHYGKARLVCQSGNWTIRQTLTFIEHCDMVVGCETGVLNAAGFRDVPKVILLSHSSHENLTRDWVNAAVLEPVATPCYPCHRLHYDRQFCPADPRGTGASLCAAQISPERVVQAIYDGLEKKGLSGWRTQTTPP